MKKNAWFYCYLQTRACCNFWRITGFKFIFKYYLLFAFLRGIFCVGTYIFLLKIYHEMHGIFMFLCNLESAHMQELSKYW